jgi:hypothetical protein
MLANLEKPKLEIPLISINNFDYKEISEKKVTYENNKEEKKDEGKVLGEEEKYENE